VPSGIDLIDKEGFVLIEELGAGFGVTFGIEVILFELESTAEYMSEAALLCTGIGDV
jgi:hypothetical protein